MYLMYIYQRLANLPSRLWNQTSMEKKLTKIFTSNSSKVIVDENLRFVVEGISLISCTIYNNTLGEVISRTLIFEFDKIDSILSNLEKDRFSSFNNFFAPKIGRSEFMKNIILYVFHLKLFGIRGWILYNWGRKMKPYWKTNYIKIRNHILGLKIMIGRNIFGLKIMIARKDN